MGYLQYGNTATSSDLFLEHSSSHLEAMRPARDEMKVSNYHRKSCRFSTSLKEYLAKG